MQDENEPEKIVVMMDSHWAGVGGEGIWAFPLGNDLYRVDNIPIYAYGLNAQDIVRATPDNPDECPIVRRVESRSGHRTLRMFLPEAMSEADRDALLEQLKSWGASYEGASKRLIAIDIPPEGAFDRIWDRLQELEDAGRLDFESCEERIEGEFGCDPDD